MSRLPKGLHSTFSAMSENRTHVNGMMVWRGHVQDLCEPTGMARNSVYRALSKLQVMDCIKLIKHGSWNAPGIYQLLKEPDDHDYYLLLERSMAFDEIRLPSKSDRTQDSLNRLALRVDELERQVKELLNGEHYPQDA